MNKEKEIIINSIKKRIDYIIDKKIIYSYPLNNENIDDDYYCEFKLKLDKYDEKLLFLYNLLDTINEE